MSTVSELLAKLKSTPGVEQVTGPKYSTTGGTRIDQYRVIFSGGDDTAKLQTLRMVILQDPSVETQNEGDLKAYWLGEYILPLYALARQKVITHLNELNPKPVFIRERLSKYDKDNMFSISDCFYRNDKNTLTRKSMVVISDGLGGVTSDELEEPYQADLSII